VAHGDQSREIEVELIDGSCAHIRRISPGDADLLRTGFERLSDESRQRRFLAAMTRLSDSMVTYLTNVDHHDHEALLATDPATGEGVGVARYIREVGTDDAETAVTVADAWQGRGLGTALLELLADRAREEGVRRFKAVVLADNRAMLEVLDGLGRAQVLDSSAGTVELVIELPEDGLGVELHDALRAAAKEPVRLALPLRPFEPTHPLVITRPAKKSQPPTA
jgi:GNAT superfamily N-acetyltransferase